MLLLFDVCQFTLVVTIDIIMRSFIIYFTYDEYDGYEYQKIIIIPIKIIITIRIMMIIIIVLFLLVPRASSFPYDFFCVSYVVL